MQVPPSHIVLVGTCPCRRRRGTSVVAHKCPCKQTCNGVSHCPPNGHEGHQPGSIRGQKFQESNRVQDVIPANGRGVESNPNNNINRPSRRMKQGKTNNVANEMYPGIPPAIIVNIAASNKEELKASRRPMISADKPQIAAPSKRPI